MKLIKTASGKQKIKLSKKEWQGIGKKNGWFNSNQPQISPEQQISSQAVQPSKTAQTEPMYPVNEAMQHIKALFLYGFNTDPRDILEVVYGDAEQRYLDEKMRLLKLGIMHFWGGLDDDHRERLFRAAWDKYGEQVQKITITPSDLE